MRPSRILYPILLIGVLAPGSAAHALSVVHPAASEVIAAGDDYATQVLGNAWDMADAVDIDTEESIAVTNQTFGSGIFSGDTAANGAYVYPLFMGYADSINSSRGAKFPIDTSRYRYVTIKLRGTQPTGTTQFVRAVFLEKDSGSYLDNTFGFSEYFTLPGNQWKIFNIDLVGQIDPTSLHQWTQFPKVMGLRIDPATTNASGAYASVHFDIDWIRLTAPATNAQKYTTQWTDSGYVGTYNVTAVDSSGVIYLLGNGINGTSFAADMTFLAPGQYTIIVARTDNSASATSGIFRINSPPQITMTAPSVRGDQTQDFASVVVGNPWGPITATDFSNIVNFKNVVYNNPVGSFYGRPTNNDPEWFLNLGGHPIDTSVYRSLCFTMEVFGTRAIGIGSVARLFWGNSAGALTTSMSIPLDTGLSEYCFPDLAAVPLEANPNGGTWSGTKAVLRLDPHEFPVASTCVSSPSAVNCHDVQLNSVVLSPFAQANPGYTFTWTFVDTDDASDTVDVYLDPDTTPGNGNEILIGSAVTASTGQYVWPGSNSVNYGTYHTLVVATDGKNAVDQYAGGVIIVGARDGIFRNGFEPLP